MKKRPGNNSTSSLATAVTSGLSSDNADALFDRKIDLVAGGIDSFLPY